MFHVCRPCLAEACELCDGFCDCDEPRHVDAWDDGAPIPNPDDPKIAFRGAVPEGRPGDRDPNPPTGHVPPVNPECDNCWDDYDPLEYEYAACDLCGRIPCAVGCDL